MGLRRLMALASLLVTGCSGLTLVDWLTPRDGYQVQRAISYGSHPRQQLDLYEPATLPMDAPVVVFFYGGGWNSGHRGDYRFVARALTEIGLVVAIPDYRLYPEVRFPTFVADGAEAVAWVARNRAGKGPILLMGHSAGAQIAALLATDDGYLQRAGVEPSDIAGLIGLAGPYDFLPLKSDYLRNVFGAPGAPEQSQPVRFVEGSEPPALLLHGADDRTVLPRNSQSLAERWTAVGGRVELAVFAGVGHATIVAALAPPLRHLAPTLAAVERFVEEIVAVRRRRDDVINFTASGRGLRYLRDRYRRNPVAIGSTLLALPVSIGAAWRKLATGFSPA